MCWKLTRSRSAYLAEKLCKPSSELWLTHIGDFFKREASDFLLAPIGTGIFCRRFSSDFLKQEQKSLANKWVLYLFMQAILHKINIKIAWKNSQCEYVKIYRFRTQKSLAWENRHVNEPQLLCEIFSTFTRRHLHASPDNYWRNRPLNNRCTKIRW